MRRKILSIGKHIPVVLLDWTDWSGDHIRYTVGRSKPHVLPQILDKKTWGYVTPIEAGKFAREKLRSFATYVIIKKHPLGYFPNEYSIDIQTFCRTGTIINCMYAKTREDVAIQIQETLRIARAA